MDKLRDGFVVGVDAANGSARLVLQACERAPFVDDYRFLRRVRGQQQNQRNEHPSFHDFQRDAENCKLSSQRSQ